MATDDGFFHVSRVIDAFKKCSEEEDGLLIDSYLEAYLELHRFFQIMGSVFSFVASDVHEKINILKNYRHSDEGENYRTIEQMINFERDNDLLNNKDRPSGSRTLLRLHRALEFISMFMRSLGKATPTDKTSSLAQSAYQDTLSKYHPWLIQKGAMLAMYTLPYRDELIKKVCGNSYIDEVNPLMGKLADAADTVYNRTQKLYAQYDLLDLP